jgi:hypothetical protein
VGLRCRPIAGCPLAANNCRRNGGEDQTDVAACIPHNRRAFYHFLCKYGRLFPRRLREQLARGRVGIFVFSGILPANTGAWSQRWPRITSLPLLFSVFLAHKQERMSE